MATDYERLDGLWPLPAEDLPRQWVLSKDTALLPDGWRHWEACGWHLAAHPDARVTSLQSKNGNFLGWLLEALTAITNGAGMVPGEVLTLDLPNDPEAALVERALYSRSAERDPQWDGLEGPWTLILPCEGRCGPRIYLAAAHSTLYSPSQQIVATSHNLMPSVQRDLELCKAWDVLGRKGHFAFGLTAFQGLRRLLPNHYLDLRTFTPHRHWPMGPLTGLADGPSGAAAIAEYGQQLINILAEVNDRFHIFMSAGRDSRAILAMASPLAARGREQLLLRTTYGEELDSLIDRHAAERLAAIAGVPLDVTKRTPHNPHLDTAQRMFVRVGEAYAGKSLSAPRLLPGAPPDPEPNAFKLPGMGGEVGRAYYWSKRDRGQAPVSPELLVSCVKAPQLDTVLTAGETWLNGLPPAIRSHSPSVLDLAYVEQRMGNWQAPSTYLFPGTLRSMNAMLGARAIEIMLSLPTDYRLAGRLQGDIVKTLWPELMQVPFNQPTGLLRAQARLESGWRRLRRLYRRIRG